MFYDKKIKYVDVYENGEKVQNAGFVRMEARESAAKLWIQVSGLRSTDTMSCPIVILGMEKEAMLGEITLERGRGVAEFVQLSVADLAGGIRYEELEEIQIRPAGVRLLRCVVQERTHKEESLHVEVIAEEELMEEVPEEVMAEEEKVEEVPDEMLLEEAPEVVMPEAAPRVEKAESKSEAELLKEAFLAEKRLRVGESEEAVQEAVPTLPIVEPTESQALPKEPAQITQPSWKETAQTTRPRIVQEPQPMDKWHQLLAIYPHIRPFEDRREYLLMKPQDFVVLAEKYFPLSENSFLLHGYYNYDHLIMCKERRPEGERIYIGVPGNFYDKEKQVAIMFGFESFEGKREPARNGDFGYYMIPVEI